jgi:exosortase
VTKNHLRIDGDGVWLFVDNNSMTGGRAGFLKTWLPFMVFGILWVDLIRQLSYMWSTNEQYAYGWFVPLFALGLLWKRSLTKPAPQLVSSPRWTLLLVVSIALMLLPVRMIHEINQDWSFCSYVLTLLVVSLSLYAVFLMGGWRWVRHFAFPICFILVAVNWPYRIENSLKYRLMNAVSGITVEIIGWLGVPAVQHGNVIELAASSVGVEDACSGIRSLQSTIMAGFFLGELYFMKWPRRFLLLALGIPLAFAFNIIRTLFLTWQASSAGESAVAKWHDSAGMSISVACFGALWLVALWLKGRTTGEGTMGPQASAGGGQSGAFASSTVFPRFQSAGTFMIVCGFWSLVCIATTEAFYRAHDTDPAQTVRWSTQLPGNTPNARELPVSKEIRQILKCDQGSDFSWEDPDGSQWSAFFFRWRAGEATSRMAARDHRPEICLPSRGFKVKADLGVHFLPVQGLELPFRTYIFEETGHVLYVFFCLWEDGAEKQAGLGRSKYLDRLDSVLAGRRRLGQQTLEIIVGGYGSMDEAEQAVRQRLPSLVQIGAAPGALTSLNHQGER